MFSASRMDFLMLRRMSSHFLVASSAFDLASRNSSPPMFMIWLCSSRTSSSTAWCFDWMSPSSPDLELTSFSSSLSLDLSWEFSVGTFMVFSLASYTSTCFCRLLTSMAHFCSRRSNSAISFSVICVASSSARRSCLMDPSLAFAFSYASSRPLTSSRVKLQAEARMPPFATWPPPPLMVPLVSTSCPWRVTTRQRVLPPRPMRVAWSRSSATSVCCSAKKKATRYSGFEGLMRSTRRGAPSGVPEVSSILEAWWPIFSRQMQVVRPRSSRRTYSISACASSVESTTMASSMEQAVETATSYFFGIVPRSPSRPWTPCRFPAFDCSYTARIRRLRVCSCSSSLRASSALVRVAATSLATSSIWPTTCANRSFASVTSFERSVFSFVASLDSCSRAFSRLLHSSCSRLTSSICSATLVVFSRRSSASVCATSTTFLTSVKRFCNGTNSASLASFTGRSSSALPFRLS
mmetsp:Transcript_30561/g.94993  ORF Transcript_30561/g.94993 Transcript_30561/m.94993 type:complete len:466 (+) Transcript_30561:2016-3413(+)